jgi:hypothetical protein
LIAWAVGTVLSFGACVDLTKPPELRGRGGAGGAGTGGVAGATSTIPSGSGGAQDSGAGGAGGALSDAGRDQPPLGSGGAVAPDAAPDGATRDVGTGGIGTGGAGGGAGGVGGGIDATPDVARSGGAGGGTGGVATGGTGGTDAPLDGSGDRPADLPLEAPGDLPPDRGPDSGPDAPPDLAVDTVDAIALPPGLTAYYPCESASGTTLLDRSGNTNNATLTIGPPPEGGPAASGPGYRFEPGKVGNALTLLKAGYGHLSMPPSIFNGATAVTVAAWVKVTTAQNWQRVFDVGVNANLSTAPETGTKYFNLVPQNESTRLEFAITTNGYGSQQVLNGPAITAASGWKHLAVTIDGSRGILYVDSLAVATNTSLTLRPADIGTIDYAYLGKSQWGQDPYFDGQLDEVRIYRRALTAVEVQTLWQLTAP